MATPSSPLVTSITSTHSIQSSNTRLSTTPIILPADELEKTNILSLPPDPTGSQPPSTSGTTLTTDITDIAHGSNLSYSHSLGEHHEAGLANCEALCEVSMSGPGKGVCETLTSAALSTSSRHVTSSRVLQHAQEIEPVGRLELSLMLEAPSTPRATESRNCTWYAGAFPFVDIIKENEYRESYAKDFILRVPGKFAIGVIAVLVVFVIRFAIAGGRVTFGGGYAIRFAAFFITSLSVFILVTPCVRRTMSAIRLSTCIEVAVLLVCPVTIVSMTSLLSATFISILFLFSVLVMIRPTAKFAIATAVSIVGMWTIVASNSLPSTPIAYDNDAVYANGILLIIVAALSGFLNLETSIAERMAFSNSQTLEKTWLATHRLLVSALPSEVLPSLIDHFIAKKEWSEAPARAEADVTIIFVRLPQLSNHAVFPENAVAAVEQLNSIWTLCDSIAKAQGITSLEVTNTEFVGVVGLTSCCESDPQTITSDSMSDDTAAAIRGGLGIIAALPSSFAAVVTIGVHCGPVVAGFVGTLRPRFTLVGDAMNTASRMASAATPGHMTISSIAYMRVSQLFSVTKREVHIKGKGSATVYDMNESCVLHADDDAAVLRRSRFGRSLSSLSLFTPAKLSKRFIPQAFNMAGFIDAETEEAFRARPVSPYHSHFITFVCVILTAFILADYDDGIESFDRCTACAVGLVCSVLLWLVTLFARFVPATIVVSTITLVEARLYGLVLFTCASPFFAQHLSVIALSSVVIIFSPKNDLLPSVIEQAAVCFVCALITSVLYSTDYYYAEEIPPEESTLGSGKYMPLVWIWLSVLGSFFGYMQREKAARARFAQAQVLGEAKIAASAVLKHLLPLSLFQRLAAGNELNTLTVQNEDVAVLVADIVGFTALSSSASSPAHVYSIVNAVFREFERVAEAEGAFKVKTVGDCIIFTAGLRDFPGPAPDRSSRVKLLARVARGMHAAAGHLALRIRIGIHVGELVSGVMNSRGFVYDIWGEGIEHAVTAEAAAPLGGTAFTKEAALELDAETLACMIESRSNVAGRIYSLIQPHRAATTYNDVVRHAFGDATTIDDANNDDDDEDTSSSLVQWSWSWDVFNGGDDEARLPSVALALLQSSLTCGLSETAAAKVVASLCASYGRLPFHSAFHGVSTLHAVLMIARSVHTIRVAFSDFDVFLLGIAALGHDAGHRGFTNAYEFASRSSIALSHGTDGPVLERFHVATTLAILQTSGILNHLEVGVRADAFHTITSAIMATDMARHATIVDDLTRCHDTNITALAHDALMGALVHTADLSAHAFPRDISLAWTSRIAAEFSSQVANESVNGLPSAPFMIGLDNPSIRARTQADFVSNVVAPLWRALSTLADHALDEPMKNVEENGQFYAFERDRLNTSGVVSPVGGFFTRMVRTLSTTTNHQQQQLLLQPTHSAFRINAGSFSSPKLLTGIHVNNTSNSGSTSNVLSPAAFSIDIAPVSTPKNKLTMTPEKYQQNQQQTSTSPRRP